MFEHYLLNIMKKSAFYMFKGVNNLLNKFDKVHNLYFTPLKI